LSHAYNVAGYFRFSGIAPSICSTIPINKAGCCKLCGVLNIATGDGWRQLDQHKSTLSAGLNDMNKVRGFAVLTSLLALVGLIYLLASGSQAPVIQWPYEAFQGLVFTLAWVLGLPASISYLVAAFVVMIVLVVCFLIGHKFARCLFASAYK